MTHGQHTMAIGTISESIRCDHFVVYFSSSRTTSEYLNIRVAIRSYLYLYIPD